jgi:UDP-N-acetylmuramoylalanine--D-glutamate ligase
VTPSDRIAPPARSVNRPAEGVFRPFAGERIALVGLGKAGLPAALRLRDWGAEVTCWDDKPAGRDAALAAGLEVADPAENFTYDALLLSPGIPHRLPRVHPAAAAARAAGKPILCDVEYLYRAVRAAGSAARFVGITGTNGKSTTTALLHHMLVGAGRQAVAGGNLGPAALAMPLLGDAGIYVLEMSSYSLERLASTRFDIAMLLNLSPDHIDRHGDMAGYATAKAHIFDRQRPQDLAILGQDDALTAATPVAARRLPISAHRPQPQGIWAEGASLHDMTGRFATLAEARALPGAHNAQNAAAASAAALALGLTHTEVAQGLLTYPGLPHRQELVAELRGVRFVNDSKATNADSTLRALASYDRVVWIAGGQPKADGIGPLAPYFPRIAHAVLIGEAAPAFAAVLAAAGVPHEILGTLDAALPAAATAAFAGKAPVVLLSPACASWDQFTGFEQRGDRFRTLVLAMKEHA